ncbi:MAG TPA: hypothetical protein VKQ36_02515 [Ktedonobacterales bacterium]|nr:hypothetical protein [Ktedonobacterales bacterium]
MPATTPIAVTPDDLHTTAQAYDGFGEFTMLTLTLITLTRIGQSRFSIPIPLDTHYTGLASAGWVEQQSGVYAFTRAPVPG